MMRQRNLTHFFCHFLVVIKRKLYICSLYQLLDENTIY